MGELTSALDFLAADDLKPMSGPALLPVPKAGP